MNKAWHGATVKVNDEKKKTQNEIHKLPKIGE